MSIHLEAFSAELNSRQSWNDEMRLPSAYLEIKLKADAQNLQLSNHKALLGDLYISKGLTLDAVIKYMVEHHQSPAEKAIYTGLFKEWGFRKYKRAPDYEFIDRTIKRRKGEGKESEVFQDGELIPDKKVKKEIARHVTTLQQLSYATTPIPPQPEGLIVSTPPAFESAEDSHVPTPISPTQSQGEYLNGLYSSSDYLVTSFLHALGTSSDRSSVLTVQETETCKILKEIVQQCVQDIELRNALQPYKWEYNIPQVVKLLVLAARKSSKYRSELELPAHENVLSVLIWVLNPDQNALNNDFAKAIFCPTNYQKALKLAIFIAAATGNSTAVHRILSEGIDVDLKDFDGRSPLHFAALNNHPEVVVILLSAGAKVDLYSSDGNTAWTRVCVLSTHDDVARILMRHGADINFCLLGEENQQPLLRKVFNGDIDGVRTGLSRGMNPSSRSSSGRSLLDHAVKDCHFEIVKLLIEAGAKASEISNSDFLILPEGVAGNRGANSTERAQIYDYLFKLGAITTKTMDAIPYTSFYRPVQVSTADEDIHQKLGSLSVSASSDLYKGSAPPCRSYMGSHLFKASSPTSRQISTSIGSLFGNGRSLPPLTQLPSPASSQRNRIARLPNPQSLKMPHPMW